MSPADYDSLESLLKEYLGKISPENYPHYAVFGIPGPVKNNEVLHVTNIANFTFLGIGFKSPSTSVKLVNIKSFKFS